MTDYNIDLSQVNGEVSCNYRLTDSYFDLFDKSTISNGDVAVDVSINKQAEEFLVSISLEGTVVIPCDRCLADMEQEIEFSDTLVVRRGVELKIGDELIVTDETDPNYDYTLPAGDTVFDLAWPMYELMILAIPIQHIHEEGLCDFDMEHLLEQHLAVLPGGNQDDSSEEDFEEEIDPRWNKLKNILNNN